MESLLGTNYILEIVEVEIVALGKEDQLIMRGEKSRLVTKWLIGDKKREKKKEKYVVEEDLGAFV